MPPNRLEDISQAQRERLFHIDFKLRFLGEVSRADLVNRFGVKAAAATRDLSLYKEVASGNLRYDTKAKIYYATLGFSPLFSCSQSQVLSALSRGLGDDYLGPHALVDNGLRWHVRAYDRLRDKFSAFVINRISRVLLLTDSRVGSKEAKDSDIQWNRIVEMHLVPHPQLAHP